MLRLVVLQVSLILQALSPNYRVDLGADKTIFASATNTITATLANNGNWTGTCNAGCVSGDWSSTWVTPTSAAGADFDARCTLNSGALTGGDTCDGSTWLSLGTTRSWSSTTAVFTLDIRRSGGSTLDSVQVTTGQI